MPTVAPPSNSWNASLRQSLLTTQDAQIVTASRTLAFPSPALSFELPSSEKKSSGSESLHAAAAVHGRIRNAQAKEARLMNPFPHQCEWRIASQLPMGTVLKS